MKRHHWLLVGAAALFIVGWLVWNVLMVETDLSAPPGSTPPASRP
jgi:hypothetical protein